MRRAIIRYAITMSATVPKKNSNDSSVPCRSSTRRDDLRDGDQHQREQQEHRQPAPSALAVFVALVL
jgi:hypothetical protein